MSPFSILLWALVIFFGYSAYRIWCARVHVRQCKKAYDLFENPNRQELAELPRFQRSYLENACREFERLGLHKIIYFQRATVVEWNTSNYTVVYGSQDGTIVASASVLVMPRNFQYFPLYLPFPEWTGTVDTAVELQSGFSDQAQLSTTDYKMVAGVTYPPNYFVKHWSTGGSIEILFEQHRKEFEKMKAERREPTSIKTSEEYFANSKRIRKVLADFRNKEMLKMLEASGCAYLRDEFEES